jgi:CheY-like chemotaxis protein
MSTGRLTLLAVDDESSQLADLARLLRSSPDVREVECASDGREALAKVSSQPFDAIFLDVRMPGLDGLELARALRRFATPPQLVFV